MFFFIHSVISATTNIENQYITQTNSSKFKEWIPVPDQVNPYELNIRYCYVHDATLSSSSSNYGGVIAVTSSTTSFTVNIYGNNFTNIKVTGDGAYGGCVYLNAASASNSWTSIYNNNFVGCSSSIYGSCLYLQSIKTADVSNNTFSETTANWGVVAYVKCTTVTSKYNYWNNLTSTNGYIYYQNNENVKSSLLVQYSCFIDNLLITHNCKYTENDFKPSIQILDIDVKEEGNIQNAVSVKGQAVTVTINSVSFNQTNCYRISPPPPPTPTPNPIPDQTPAQTVTPRTPGQTVIPRTPGQTVIPQTKSPDAAKSGSATKKKTGMIVGIVIACLVVLAIIILLIIFFAKRDTRTAYANDADDAGVDGFAVH